MPGTPRPIVHPVLGVLWGSVDQALKNGKAAINGLNAQQQQQGSYDQYGNIASLIGSNLQQVVPIGATWVETAVSPHVPAGQTAAVYVATGSNTGKVGVQSGTAGMIVPSKVATGTLTVTAGSTAATVSPSLGSTFAVDQMIGAYLLDATTGVTTQALTPGTYISVLSGTSVTLSQVALVSGSGLYCAACTFSQVS